MALQRGISAMDFNNFWNKGHESVSRWWPVWKFQLSAQGCFAGPKTQFWGFKSGVLVLSEQIKRHNLGQWQSFQGLANIQGCAFVREFWREMYGLGTTTPEDGAKFAISFMSEMRNDIS